MDLELTPDGYHESLIACQPVGYSDRPYAGLWLLTEERPKASVVAEILNLYNKKNPNLPQALITNTLTIDTVFLPDGRFAGTYVVCGVKVSGLPIYISVISGTSSFVDYLVFKGPLYPNYSEAPLMLIEVTKTSDKESRNTGINQRGTKFIHLQNFYPEAQKIMYFDRLIPTEPLSPTHLFGRRLYATIGGEIAYKGSIIKPEPFSSILEMADARALIPAPLSASNVPTSITIDGDDLCISARLIKGNTISHDPNIGYVALAAGAARALGHKGRITVVNHGLPDNFEIRGSNKFAYAMELLDIDMQGLRKPSVVFPSQYWVDDHQEEKNATILAAIMAESAGKKIIYENHGGSERGYLYDRGGKPHQVPKKTKNSNGTLENITIPDLVEYDPATNMIWLWEGKKADFWRSGINQLNALGNFICMLREYYPTEKICRGLVLHGSWPEGDSIEKCPYPVFGLTPAGTIYKSG